KNYVNIATNINIIGKAKSANSNNLNVIKANDKNNDKEIPPIRAISIIGTSNDPVTSEIFLIITPTTIAPIYIGKVNPVLSNKEDTIVPNPIAIRIWKVAE